MPNELLAFASAAFVEIAKIALEELVAVAMIEELANTLEGAAKTEALLFAVAFTGTTTEGIGLKVMIETLGVAVVAESTVVLADEPKKTAAVGVSETTELLAAVIDTEAVSTVDVMTSVVEDSMSVV